MTVLRDYAAGLTQRTLPDEVPAYDEVVAPDGFLRPAWRGLAEGVVGLTSGDLARVHAEIARFLADDGVTYARPGQRQAPWRLDPVPLVLDAAGWAPLEVGLAQRAELLNAVLVDLYGEQRLLSEGTVPAAVVLGHAGFTRAVARPSAVDPRPLVLSATDLGRDATGEWRVLADRAQAPSGLGYAVQNRRVVSRVLPELYRQAPLHRMEPYVAALRSALLQSAEDDLADPRVVVLSPGTHSETAYDQARIASALGFPLVQGSDLLVRDGWVHMRPAPGRGGPLERVDVILRRVDASWSDPLELRGDSQLGVAGLVEAVRRGRVRIVNGFGAGVLENPGLLPYLPAACEALLGEPLRLASVPTWWCGDPDGLDHVLGHLDELTVRTLDGPVLAVAPSQLRDRLLAAPHRFVAQQPPALSQSPTWTAGGARARPLSLRTFTLRYGSAYRPMVGGLATAHDVTRPEAAVSKDVWVLKADAAEPDQGISGVMPLTTARAVAVLGPRVLEGMWWVGRYAERAEDLLRVVLVAHALGEDYRSRPRSTGGATLAVLLGVVERLAGHQHDDLDLEFRSLLLDPVRPGSAAQALEALRDALLGVRDQLSGDVWRSFGAVERATEALTGSPYSHQAAESAGRMLTAVLSLQGVTASMVRDPGWHLIGAGRSLERAVQLCHLLRPTTTGRRGMEVDRVVLDAVLTAAESAVTHRRRYRDNVRISTVLDLLLTDADNPRSLAFCLAELSTHLAALPASTGSTRPERLLDDLIAALASREVATLSLVEGAGRPFLEAFLDDCLVRLMTLADAVAALHLAGGPLPRPLAFGPVADRESA